MEPVNPYVSPQQPEGAVAQPQRLVTLGDILLKGIALYVANAPAVFGAVAIVCGPLELMRTYHHYYIAEPQDAGQTYRVAWVLEELVRLVFFGAIIAIGNAAMKGEQPTVWYGLRSGLEAWPRMVATEIVVGVITLLALVALIVPGIYVMTRSALAGQVAVIERLGGMASMKRSFELTQGQSWRYLALLIVLTAVMFLASALIWLPMTLFPELNHWLVAASLSLLIDALAGWTRLVLVAAYWASARPTMTDGQMSLMSGNG